MTMQQLQRLSIFEKSNPENVVDHIDHNTLNNVRNNLREVSLEQVALNVSITLNSTTKCRNITIEDGKYRVRIGGHSFGRYNTLEEAQEVVRRERKKIYFLYPLSQTTRLLYSYLYMVRFLQSLKILASDVDYINSYHTFHYLHLDRYKC